MKLFSGFPAGKLQVTPLPNLFFSELCPAIDDLAELKVTLHLFWLLAHKKDRQPHVRASELRADHTLLRSLATADAKTDDALGRALGSAAARGTLLRLRVRDDDLYFLNTESGRRAFEKLARESELPLETPAREQVPVGERPNIFALYEQNIGLLTPLIVEELKDAEQEYPVEWIAEAFKIAVENNKRNWRYVRKILERWKTEGRGAKKDKTWYGPEYSQYVKR